jgi:predicted RecA/RadA family phage recombinase
MGDLKYPHGDQIAVTAAGVTAGDPVAVGNISGVALTSSDDDNQVVIKRNGSVMFTVAGSSGNPVAVGDCLYYHAGPPVVINKAPEDGVFIGWALETAATSKEIEVLLAGGEPANPIGVAAFQTILDAGVGASGSYSCTDVSGSPDSLLAADDTINRAVLVVAICTEDVVAGTGDGAAAPTFQVGEAGTANKFFTTTALGSGEEGDVFVSAGILTKEKDLIVTWTTGGGVGPTGAYNITVLALPTA